MFKKLFNTLFRRNRKGSQAGKSATFAPGMPEKVYPTREAVEAAEIKETSVEAKDSAPFTKDDSLVYYIQGIDGGLTYTTYSQVKQALDRADLKLVYIPLIIEEVSKASLQYNFPWMKDQPSLLTAMGFYTSAAESLGITLDQWSKFLVRYDTATDSFKVIDLSVKTREEFITKAFAYAESQKKLIVIEDNALESIPCEEDSEVRFSISSDDSDIRFSKVDDSGIRFRVTEDKKLNDDDFFKTYTHTRVKSADERFEEDQEKMAAEARALIQKLLMNDFSREVIQSWLYDSVIISHLKVARHYKIILPEYNNMEVKLTPLEKTIFLFYLKNPKGYAFKELPSHKKEIMAIYEKLARTSSLEEIRKSVTDLTDPYGTSISEKCARIKSKFITLMPEAIAKNYFIAGPQGGAKKISLDRKLVEWEVEI